MYWWSAPAGSAFSLGLHMQAVGHYHLGDFVNRFRHGCLVMKLPDSDAAKIPTVLFGTINGSIGVLASLPQEQFKFLERLQVRHSTMQPRSEPLMIG